MPLTPSHLGRWTLSVMVAIASSMSAESLFAVAATEWPNDEVTLWVYSHRQDIVGRLLPVDRLGIENYPKNMRWIVKIRIDPTTRPEEAFIVKKDSLGRVEVVRLLVRDGLIEQMQRAKRQHAEWSADDVAARIEIERTVATGAECPELVRVVDRLERLRLDSIPGTWMLGGATYTFLIQTELATRVEGEFTDSDETGKQRYPIARWTDELRRVLEGACERRRQLSE